MRGHGKILEARIAGHKPSFVFLNDYPCKTNWFEFGEHATVSTYGDPIISLDLRFLKGVNVSISSRSEERAKALFERAKEAGATVVSACHVQDEHHPHQQSGWVAIWHKEVTNA